MTFGFGFSRNVSGGGGQPETMDLTGFFRSPYVTTQQWDGTPSNGTSGSGNNDWTVGVSPAQGTPLNGYSTANFVAASSQTFIAEGTFATYIAATSFSGWGLINPRNSGTATGFIMSDIGSAAMGLSFGADNLIHLKANANAVNVQRAITASTYSLITFRYTGSVIQVGVNEPPGASGGASTASFSTSLTLTNQSLIGYNGVGGFYDGHIADFAISKVAYSDAIFDAIRTKYINPRYALNL